MTESRERALVTTERPPPAVRRYSDSRTLFWGVVTKNREVGYCVPLAFTKCNFGSSRPWSVCLGSECGERVGKLYRPPPAALFLCRHCHDLGYESSQKSGTPFYENVTRPLQAANAARAALRNGDDPFDPERLKDCYEAR